MRKAQARRQARWRFEVDGNAIAGISGGSTSGMMAAFCRNTLLSFQNTGKEAPRTYAFLEELEEGLGQEIVWLEYRPPLNLGDPPASATWARVNSQTADRSGAPFEMLLDAIAAYRKTMGKGPIAPWWRSRICTTYMKTRLARKYVSDLGWKAWTEFVGLRNDEPDRVGKLRVGVPRRIGRLAPLDEIKVTKADVNEFWNLQSFKLDLPGHLGNCGGCFLKDQADLSRALVELGDADWWEGMAKRFPGFGGKNFVGYAILAKEYQTRIHIEAALRNGRLPIDDEVLTPRRFKLVVIQERKRIAGEVAPFSCSCEGSDFMADMDENEENTFIAELPEEA